MFDIVRSSPERIPPHARSNTSSDFLDEKIADKIEKLGNKRAHLPLKLGAAGIALSSLIFAYNHDVAANQEKSHISQPSIETITKAEAQSESSIFFLAGFDTKDGKVFGQKVGITLQQITPGGGESINYGDAPLEPVEIANKIISYAEEKQLTSISLAGNSMGGIVSIKVAEHIITDSYLEIDAIYLNSTPDGKAGLRPGTKSDLAAMIDVLEVIPNSKYSNVARYALTLAQESDSYLHEDTLKDAVESFVSTSNRVIEQVNQNRRPGVWLLVDQALSITHADINNSLANIGELRGEKRMPVVVYMGAENPTDDTVVDIEKSSTDICSYAEEADIYCSFVPVKDSIHTSYLFNTENFATALEPFTEDIKQQIQNEKTSHAHERYGDWLIDYHPEGYTVTDLPQ